MDKQLVSLLGLIALLLLAFPSGTTLAAAQADEAFAALQSGRVDEVRSMVEADPTLVNAIDASGYGLLHWACVRGHFQLALFLVEAGAPTDLVGADGGTPLHWACHHDEVTLIEALLDAGAPIEHENRWGRRALHVVARRGARRAAETLVARGAALDARTREGWTPLHVARRSGHRELADWLETQGADPAARDEKGRTPAQDAWQRPASIELNPEQLRGYCGEYGSVERGAFLVWLEDDALRVREFAPDDLVPVAEDTFVCRGEPWTLRFARGPEGAIEALEVEFLRRSVRLPRMHGAPAFVGSRRCASCHSDGPGGAPFVSWMASRHALAYWRLATDWAAFLASRREDYHDVESPIEEERCLACHTSDGHAPGLASEPSYRDEEGVGCEACHGAGSLYMDPEVMADRTRFLARGGRLPGERVCAGCHRKGFHFETHRERLAHPR